MALSTRFLLPALVLAVLAAACGGGDDAPDPTATAASTGSSGATGATGANGTTGPTGGNGSVIGSYTDVQPAVIQVIAQGSFRDPAVGISTGAGAGSGFIISSDGLAVTNNHVVAGAATLEVFIGGDDSRGYNATILGVSECNDLALIDIREDEPLPFLKWYEDDVQPGIDIYVAGFPLGDPEYTLNRGIVSKARANGETDWSSLDYSIEHDANTQPGNSGGPLVAPDGSVVGVHYAATGDNTAVRFAIPGEIAQDVIEELKDGNYESIGINGWAVFDQSLGISGIWVAGVSAGTPAAKAGIKPGDIITALNGLPMGTDGTMSDYCDVFRTTGYDKPMTVEVLRYDTGQVLRGEVNSDKTLEVVSVAAAIEEETDVDTGGGTAPGYSSYQSITDDTGKIVVNVPTEWSYYTTPCVIDGADIPCVSASPDLDAFFAGYQNSGMIFALFGPTESAADVLGRYKQDHCTYEGTYEYSDPVFVGLYDVWENCGSTGAVLINLAAAPESLEYTAFLQFVIEVEADWEALDEAFATFNVLQ